MSDAAWTPRPDERVRVIACPHHAGQRPGGKVGVVWPSWLKPHQIVDGHSVAVAFDSYVPREMRKSMELGPTSRFICHFRVDELAPLDAAEVPQ